MSKDVSNYQCSGCMRGSSTSSGCYKPKSSNDLSCRSHVAGTLTNNGKILLGMPRGFNRLGPFEQMEICIFQDKESFTKEWGEYNKFNLPVWKFKNKDGHIFVRGMSPRRNQPFLHIFLEDSIYAELQCQEITEEDISEMD